MSGHLPRFATRPARAPGPAALLVVMLTTLITLPIGAAVSAGPATAAPAAPGRAGPATGFVLPVPPPPVVLVPFDPPPDRYAAGHRGVDLAAPVGTVVTAAGPGRVVFAGTVVDRGVVSVEHEGGLRTTYEPVTATVPAGTVVAAG
ncbi:peptidoglycan DD-metalloendopeptidase family protein, partial [Nakamurella sp.]|uniref:peptidoglycan DD-metalloendopeptidase family protein n=1 Tax=Nakamurella sp. TaxID=1869182 RepID=UPI003B3B6269